MAKKPKAAGQLDDVTVVATGVVEDVAEAATGEDWSEATVHTQAELREWVAKVMRDYGYSIHRRMKFEYELRATKEEFGGVRQIFIYCGDTTSDTARRAFEARDPKHEYWFVDHKIAPKLKRRMKDVPFVHLHEIEELDFANGFENAANAQQPARGRRARTKVGRGILLNQREILLLARALETLIQEKIDELPGLRINDPDEEKARRSEYESLKEQVSRLAASVQAFVKKKVKEVDTVEVVTSFAEKVEKWAKRNPNTSSVGLVAAAVGLGALCGADGTVATVVYGAMVGGKSVTDAIKAAFRKSR